MIETLPHTPPWVDSYIVHLRRTGLERTAAAAAGTTTRQVNLLRERDLEFDLACKDAEEQAADVLELEARRRAVDGIEKGVYYQGERVDTQIEYSDTLLGTLLKGRRETVFGDKRKLTFSEPLTVHIRTFDSQPAAPPSILSTTHAASIPNAAQRPVIEHEPLPPRRGAAQPLFVRHPEAFIDDLV